MRTTLLNSFLRRVNRTFIVGISVALLLIIVTYYDTFIHFSTHFLGGARGDAALYHWLGSVSLDALRPSQWFTLPAFYPYEGTLAWSDNFILPSSILYLLRFLYLNEVAAWNTLLLATIFLNSVTFFSLTFRLTRSLPLSTLASLFVVRGLPLSSILGHPQLLFIFWFPLLWRALEVCAYHRNMHNSLTVALITCGTFFCSVYYALFQGVLILLAIPTICGWKVTKKEFFRSTLALLLLGAAMIPFVTPYLVVGKRFGERALFEIAQFAASPLSYLSTTPWSSVHHRLSLLSHDEARLFPGVMFFLLLGWAIRSFLKQTNSRAIHGLLIALFCGTLGSYSFASPSIRSLLLWSCSIGCVCVLRRTLHTSSLLPTLLLSSCIFSLILSFGPQCSAEGQCVWWSPYALTTRLISPLGAIRAVGRFGIVTYLAAIPLILHLLSKSSLVARHPLLVVACGAAAFVETSLSTYPLEPLSPRPHIFSHLSGLPTHSIIVTLPFESSPEGNGTISSWKDFAITQMDVLRYSSDVNLNWVNGYSGVRTWAMKHFPRWFQTFPSPTSLEGLSRLGGLSHVLYRGSLMAGFQRSKFEAQVATTPSLSLIAQEGNDYLFHFSPSQELGEGKEARFYLPRSTQQVEITSSPQCQEKIEIVENKKAVEFEKNSPTFRVALQNLDDIQALHLLSITSPTPHCKLTSVKYP
jgi:hypothetical protein